MPWRYSSYFSKSASMEAGLVSQPWSSGSTAGAAVRQPSPDLAYMRCSSAPSPHLSLAGLRGPSTACDMLFASTKTHYKTPGTMGLSVIVIESETGIV